jgi:DNA-binding beta-propeller fold protein YncE
MDMSTRFVRILFYGVSIFALAACSGDEAKGYARQAYDYAPPQEEPPPVVEDEKEASNDQFLRVAPAFNEQYLFVANPTIDSITKIAVEKPHAKELIPVGLYPTLVKSVGTRVLVLNSGDHTVTFVTAATSKTYTEPIPKEINDIVFNNAGHGIGYVNAAKLPSDITGGSQSTDLFSIINIDEGLVVTKGISFAPKHIVFTASNPPMALLAADSKGLLVNLNTPTAKPQPLTFSQSLTASKLEEAAITPSGARAFFREQGQTGIRVLELATNTLGSVAGDAIPTDMDLSPDGLRLFVSDRAAGFRLREYDAATTALTLLSTVTSSLDYGQTEFSPDGSKAVLFSTATDQAVVGVLDMASGEVLDVNVQLPVQAALPAPGNAMAILVHRNPAGTFLPQKITMLNLETGEEPDVDLEGDLDKIDFSPDGMWAYLTTKQPDYLVALSLSTSLHNVRELNNEPVFMAAIPGAGGKVFVSQSHAIGQITFFDVTQTLSTVQVVPDEVIGFLLGTTAE